MPAKKVDIEDTGWGLETYMEMRVLTFVFDTFRVENLGIAGTEARGLGEANVEADVSFVFFGAIGGLEEILALFAKEGEEVAPTSEI